MNRNRLLVPLAILLLAAGLREGLIGAQALRGDEAYSVTFTQLSFGEQLRAMASFDPNPPLYPLLLAGWIRLVGQSELAMRWPSVLASVMVVALTYRLGVAWLGHAAARPAAAAAALAAVNPLLVWYARDVRVYALLGALVLGCAWATWQAARTNRRLAWLAGGLAAWAALLAHYFAILPLLGLGVGLLAAPSTRTRWRQALAMVGAVALAYLPWAAYVAPFVTGHSKGWILSRAAGELVGQALTVFSAGEAAAGGTPRLQMIGALLLGLLSMVGIATAWRRPAGAWLLGLALAPAGLLWLISGLIRPVFTPQYAMTGLPGVLLLAAAGWHGLAAGSGRWRGAGLLAGSLPTALILVGLLSLRNHLFEPTYAKSPDLRAVVAALNRTARPGDLIILNQPDPAFYFYYRGPLPVETSPPLPLAAGGQAAAETQLSSLRERYQHLRFFFSPHSEYDPDGWVKRWLEACCELTDETRLAGLPLLTFDTPAASLEARQPYSITFSNGLALTGYRLQPPQAPAGTPVRLTLFWTTDRPVPEAYTVFVHLLAADGFDVLDADSQPRGGARPTEGWAPGEVVIDPHTLHLPADLPAGEYTFEIGLYLLETGQRLGARGPEGTPGDHFWLPQRLDVLRP